MSQSSAPTIPEFINRERAMIADLCQKYGIGRLELFGSAVSERFAWSSSDLDFLIEFTNETPPEQKLRRYFAFKEELEALFLRSVDLVFLSAVRNPYVLRAIERERALIYAA